MIDCETCPLRRHEIFEPMTDQELAFMKSFKTGELEVEKGAVLMLEGANSPHMYTALEGMGIRYKTLESGERQVINFVFPGDFIGLQAGVMKTMQHTVEATTPMRLCVFNRNSLWSLFHNHADRAYDLTWIAAVEEHFLGESLAEVGKMNGEERIARAFVRLFDRAKMLGLENADTVPLPFRQHDLADATGLSLVHTNKKLKYLREAKAANWKDGKLKILNYEKLCTIGKLDLKPSAIVRPLM